MSGTKQKAEMAKMVDEAVRKAMEDQSVQMVKAITEALQPVMKSLADAVTQLAEVTKALSPPSVAAGDHITHAVPAADSQVNSSEVVIMGLKEKDELRPRERRHADEESVSDILENLEIDAIPLQVYRMGTFEKNKCRLVKVVFNNSHDAVQVLRNCNQLKNIEGPYKNVYARPSYSAELRKQLRDARKIDMSAVIYRGKVVSRSAIPKNGRKGGNMASMTTGGDANLQNHLPPPHTQSLQTPTCSSPAPTTT